MMTLWIRTKPAREVASIAAPIVVGGIIQIFVCIGWLGDFHDQQEQCQGSGDKGVIGPVY
jgi:hypothetical protein